MNRVGLRLFIISIVLAIAGIGILSRFYVMYKESDDYAIVFDAGSGGTRMYVYKWKSGFSPLQKSILEIHEVAHCVTRDKGIDKFKNKHDLIDSFSGCIKVAEDMIPNDRKHRAYLTLAATAGMRLLSVNDPIATNRILEFTREYFSSLNFLYTNSTQVQIIDGKDEGTYAWISANYFLKNFKPVSYSLLAKHEIELCRETSFTLKSATPSDTVGILDLGGASTQIVYITNNVSNANTEQFFSETKIYGVDYSPYSNSYNCRGVHQMREIYNAFMLKNNSYEKTISASCYPSGYALKKNPNDFINAPCTNGVVFNNSFTFAPDKTKIDNATDIIYNGTSNFNECVNEINKLIQNPTCPYDSCALDSVYRPSIENHTFLAFSVYFYALQNTEKLLRTKIGSDMNKFTNATNTICSLTQNQLIQMNQLNNNIVSLEHLVTLCIRNVYIQALLKAYGFKDYSNITITDKVANYTVGWTLGYLINKLNRNDFLPYEAPKRLIPNEYYIPSVTVLSMFTLISTIFFIIKLRKFIKNNYQLEV